MCTKGWKIETLYGLYRGAVYRENVGQHQSSEWHQLVDTWHSWLTQCMMTYRLNIHEQGTRFPPKSPHLICHPEGRETGTSPHKSIGKSGNTSLLHLLQQFCILTFCSSWQLDICLPLTASHCSIMTTACTWCSSSAEQWALTNQPQDW